MCLHESSDSASGSNGEDELDPSDDDDGDSENPTIQDYQAERRDWLLYLTLACICGGLAYYFFYTQIEVRNRHEAPGKVPIIFAIFYWACAAFGKYLFVVPCAIACLTFSVMGLRRLYARICFMFRDHDDEQELDEEEEDYDDEEYDDEQADDEDYESSEDEE